MVSFGSILHEKWGISWGTLVGQPRPFSPGANLHPTQSIDQTYSNNFKYIRTEDTSEDRML